MRHRSASTRSGAARWCGACRHAARRRRSRLRRARGSAGPTCERSGAPAGAPAGAAPGARRPLPDFASSISRAMTRPCGPEPCTRERSMPASLASRRASGEEKMRLPPLAAAGCGAGDAAGFGGGAACGAGAAGFRRFGFCSGFGRLCGLRRRSSSRLCRARRRLHVLAFARKHGDHRIDGNVLRALGHDDLGERAFVDRLVFHRRLVGLDLGDHVAGLDLVAFLLEPRARLPFSMVGDSAGMRMLVGIASAYL